MSTHPSLISEFWLRHRPEVYPPEVKSQEAWLSFTMIAKKLSLGAKIYMALEERVSVRRLGRGKN